MTGTPVVPDDMKPEPRPKHEMLLELPGGYSMPQNGIGMCCRPSAYDDDLVKETVLWYLLSGGRLIDGAQLYLNHKAIGEGIRQAIQRGVPRSEIFVTTKVWVSNYGYNTTKGVVPKFLKELGLDYIDLVLMHFPGSFIPGTMSKECSNLKLSSKECRQETFKALSSLRQQGLIRNVGVSNHAIRHLKDIQELDDVAPIAANQIVFNPWVPKSWKDTFHYCQQNNIAVTAYNSLGGLFQHAEAKTVKTLTDLANKYRKTVAQIMLRWALQKNAAVIPGTGNPKHMKENLDIYSFSITSEDMNAINDLEFDESAKKMFSMEPINT
eukprot:CAMPEP_0197828838 /NCGR_PEP_ID=MMETSP1437-20131217/5356_1 /TAXON_ID=49252 ORGANISM="Eucampia antarctica, Strain CCMP1452" /NCGR_SAMPLE_ID=MMETSP1437 /ASSEMBLY_ACC=CAM_ASM_001096 /LENGTH=323 /DNA_ID=CAMNT_0043430237 /DNA_START=445 /DNA_END=1416 /DNA_ORIENTATION=-